MSPLTKDSFVTLSYKGRSVKLTPKSWTKKRIKRVTADEICSSSSMRVRFKGPKFRLDGVSITMGGSAAAIPSKSNAMMATLNKSRLFSMAMCSSFPQNRSALVNEIRRVHPTLRKNPDHIAYLEALTTLYMAQGPLSLAASDAPSFNDTKHDRLLVLILLADSCDRRDSHNLPKAVCDWLQEIGLIRNDLHAEAFAVPKRTLSNPRLASTTTTIIVLRRMGKLERVIRELVDHAVDDFLTDEPEDK